MSANPYAPPDDAAAPPASNPLLPVAITLIVLCVLWMLFCAFGIAKFVFAAANTNDSGMIRFYRMNTGTLLICLVFQTVLISGAVSMLRKGSYVWSFVTCTLACVPALSPCYFLAIPIGIWGLVLLWRPATQAMFPETPPQRRALCGIAMCLMTLTITGMIFALFAVNYFVSTTLTEKGWQMLWMPLTFLAIHFVYQLVLLYGATQMVGAGSYRSAIVTCSLACVPLLGPCYFFAIPLGIWGIVVLRRPEVRDSFKHE